MPYLCYPNFKLEKSMNTKHKIAIAILLILCSIPFVNAHILHGPTGGHIMVMPGEEQWVDAPASLPAGAKVAIIEGNPKAEGLFTMRLKLPAGYEIKPHWHGTDEHITVIEGTFHMGLGESFDKDKGRSIPAGGFAVMATGTRHYAFTTSGCTVQLHGMGPWVITYVNAEDDPRNK